MRREIGSVRLDVENKKQGRDGQRQASAQHRAIRGRNEQQRQQRRKKAAHQSSVSCATRRRACSSSSGEIPAAEDALAIRAAGAARFRQRLITKTTSMPPTNKYTTGMAHATRPIPLCGGSISPTCPYSSTNAC